MGRLFQRLGFKLAASLALWLIATALAAQLSFPELSGRVVDEAGLLSGRDRQELQSVLERLEADTTHQVVVVTLTSLQEQTIEDYGYQLGRHWAIGQAEKDNGALLIVAPEERQVRIEVGYGLEGELTDAASHRIIQEEILPWFRRGDFSAGIKAGVAAMINVLGGRYDPSLPAAPGRDEAPAPLPLMLLVPLIMFIIFNRMMRNGRGVRGRRRGAMIFPGGGGGWSRGGGFRGGGGGFGGGGASGSW